MFISSNNSNQMFSSSNNSNQMFISSNNSNQMFISSNNKNQMFGNDDQFDNRMLETTNSWGKTKNDDYYKEKKWNEDKMNPKKPFLEDLEKKYENLFSGNLRRPKRMKGYIKIRGRNKGKEEEEEELDQKTDNAMFKDSPKFIVTKIPPYYDLETISSREDSMQIDNLDFITKRDSKPIDDLSKEEKREENKKKLIKIMNKNKKNKARAKVIYSNISTESNKKYGKNKLISGKRSESKRIFY